MNPYNLYEVEVKPMRSGTGYVIVDAKQVFFAAQVEVIIIPGSTYKICIKFGNKNIFFDPLNGRTPSSSTIKGVIDVLMSRDDIENKSEILNSFFEEANKLVDRMTRDGMVKV